MDKRIFAFGTSWRVGELIPRSARSTPWLCGRSPRLAKKPKSNRKRKNRIGIGLTERLLRYTFYDMAPIAQNSQDTPLLPSKHPCASPAMPREASQGTSAWLWSLVTCPLGSNKCRPRIPPYAFNSACAVRSFKALWGRFVATHPHHRESPTTMHCRSRCLYPLLQAFAVRYSFLLYERQQCTTSSEKYAELTLSSSRGEKMEKKK